MFASYFEMRLKPEKTAEAMELANQIEPGLGQMGMKQFIITDKSDDNSTPLSLYDSANDRDTAGPKVAELIGRLADHFAAPSERKKVEVPINVTF